MKDVTIIYWSGTGNTEKMAEAIAEGANLGENNVKVIRVEDASKEDVINAEALALGCPAMGDEELEESYMEPFVASLENIDWKDKPTLLFGSYEWNDGDWMLDWYMRMERYGAKIIDDGIIAKGSPGAEETDKCTEMGKELASK